MTVQWEYSRALLVPFNDAQEAIRRFALDGWELSGQPRFDNQTMTYDLFLRRVRRRAVCEHGLIHTVSCDRCSAWEFRT